MSRMTSARETVTTRLRILAQNMADGSSEQHARVGLSHDQREFDREAVALVRAAADAIEDARIVVES